MSRRSREGTTTSLPLPPPDHPSTHTHTPTHPIPKTKTGPRRRLFRAHARGQVPRRAGGAVGPAAGRGGDQGGRRPRVYVCGVWVGLCRIDFGCVCLELCVLCVVDGAIGSALDTKQQTSPLHTPIYSYSYPNLPIHIYTHDRPQARAGAGGADGQRLRRGHRPGARPPGTSIGCFYEYVLDCVTKPCPPDPSLLTYPRLTPPLIHPPGHHLRGPPRGHRHHHGQQGLRLGHEECHARRAGHHAGACACMYVDVCVYT